MGGDECDLRLQYITEYPGKYSETLVFLRFFVHNRFYKWMMMLFIRLFDVGEDDTNRSEKIMASEYIKSEYMQSEHLHTLENETKNTQGVLFVHSCPRALSPHLEWAMGRAIGRSVSFEWTDQQALPGTRRAEFVWAAPVGTAAVVASSLLGWDELRFEITEDASPGVDGGRWLHTPHLGTFHMQLDSAGNAVISEDRLRYAMEVAGSSALELQRELKLALGQAWDDELEPFRYAGDGASVVWLRQTS